MHQQGTTEGDLCTDGCRSVSGPIASFCKSISTSSASGFKQGTSLRLTLPESCWYGIKSLNFTRFVFALTFLQIIPFSHSSRKRADVRLAMEPYPPGEPAILDHEFRADGLGTPHLHMKAGGSLKPPTHQTADARF